MQLTAAVKAHLRRETLFAVILILAGLILVPVSIWFVGEALFGSYAGDGFGGFYAELMGRLGQGSVVAWFLVLSPLLVIASARLTVIALQFSRRRAGKSSKV